MSRSDSIGHALAKASRPAGGGTAEEGTVPALEGRKAGGRESQEGQ